MAQQALAGVKVLDVSHYVTGPYCTKLLADYGAAVIKIERPGKGDPARMFGPFKGDDPHPEKSALFFFLNMNKRGITLNLKTVRGKEIFLELLKDADIVVESFAPGTMSSFGLDYEALAAIKPNLVMASISNFGQSGPYRDWKATDAILTAMGYEMYSHGLPELPPLKNPLTRDLIAAGGMAAAGVMAAYYGARWQGIGQQVDIALFEELMSFVDVRMASLVAYAYSGRINERIPFGGGVATGAFACKDGYFEVAAGIQYLPRIIEMIGDERLKDPEFLEKDIFIRKPEKLEEFNAVWYDWLSRYTRQELDKIFQEYKLQASPHQAPDEVCNDPHFTSRGCFIDVEHPVMGSVRTLSLIHI